MTCPLGKKSCQGCPYQKEGLCDYPYKVGMTLEQIKKVEKDAKNIPTNSIRD